MKVLAHRGVHQAPPTGPNDPPRAPLDNPRGPLENTVEAFQAAKAIGAAGVELDVRLTTDGVLVVHHDPDVDGIGPLAQVRAAQLPGWIPTLAAALDACADLEVVNVEVKHDAPDATALARATAEWLRQASQRGGPELLVSSFSLDVLDVVRDHAPGLATGWLTVLPLAADEMVRLVVDRGHAALHPHERLVDGPLVKLAHRHALRVAAWTVNDLGRAAELKRLGADILISDRPADLLTVS